jgi:hypothetical protein
VNPSGSSDQFVVCVGIIGSVAALYLLWTEFAGVLVKDSEVGMYKSVFRVGFKKAHLCFKFFGKMPEIITITISDISPSALSFNTLQILSDPDVFIGRNDAYLLRG